MEGGGREGKMVPTALRRLVVTFVISYSFLKSYTPSGVTYMFRAMEAKLHTATCSYKVMILMLHPHAPPSPYFIRGGVLHYLRAQIAALDGTQVLLVALAVAAVLVQHVRCA